MKTNNNNNNPANDANVSNLVPTAEYLQKSAKEKKQLTDAEKQEQAIHKAEKQAIQRTDAKNFVDKLQIEATTLQLLENLFKKHKIVFCLEKSGAKYAYKGSDLNFYITAPINVIAYFSGCTQIDLEYLQGIAKNVKGSPKYLRVINKNGKTANLGSVNSFKNVGEVFDFIAKLTNDIESKMIKIPQSAPVNYILEEFMQSRERGINALSLTTKDSDKVTKK